MERTEVIERCKKLYGSSFDKVYSAFQSIEQEMINPNTCLEALLYGEKNAVGKSRTKTALIGIQREKVGEALAVKLNEIAEQRQKSGQNLKKVNSTDITYHVRQIMKEQRTLATR